MARLSGRLTYANVVASLALFVALGGSGYAAVTLSKNSVGSKQIKNGAIKNADLAKNAVTSAKVKDGSLLSADFKPGQVVSGAPGPAGPKGDTGLTGPKGADGAKGTNGTNGTARAYAYVSANGVLDANRTKGFTAVSHTSSSGVYCVTLDPALGIDSTTVAPVVSIEFNTAPGLRLFAFFAKNQCAAGQIGALTANEDGSGGTAWALSDEPFTLIVP